MDFQNLKEFLDFYDPQRFSRFSSFVKNLRATMVFFPPREHFHTHTHTQTRTYDVVDFQDCLAFSIISRVFGFYKFSKLFFDFIRFLRFPTIFSFHRNTVDSLYYFLISWYEPTLTTRVSRDFLGE